MKRLPEEELERLRRRAEAFDRDDPLAALRDAFCFPQHEGRDVLYFAGNSLGLQPKGARALIGEALDDWARHGVEGHTQAKDAWLPYHELVAESLARVVGAEPGEVVAMNSLTVNLHLMLVSFYRPDGARRKILVEAAAFPSDQYALDTHLRSRGGDPARDLVELSPREGELTLRHEDLLAAIERHGPELSLVLLGQSQYLTGQAFDLRALAAATHRVGAWFGVDLAHGAGNLELALHDDGVDFAVWCSYKYLNAGPGGIAGCFVHARHAERRELPRYAGWWAHDKASRFAMPRQLQLLAGAEGWQLSNPPIFQLAALRASLALFDRAGMQALRHKSVQLSSLLYDGLEAMDCAVWTPRAPAERGTQLTVQLPVDAHQAVTQLAAHGVVADAREPGILRFAPVALYTKAADVVVLLQALGGLDGQ